MGRTKETLSVTIDKAIFKKLNDYCDKNVINRSRFIEKLISDFLEGKK
jgi:metal-responsive CopG/Arc/MetJ family transcriptional regulator